MKQRKRSWVLIRGLARNSQHWGEFDRKLQERFPEDDFEKLDLAGNGFEAHRQSFLTIEENVEDLRRRSRFLNEGRKLSLCSISMGSMIALLWAQKYPDEIEAVVVMNSSSRSHSRFFERLRPRNYVRFLKMAFDGRDLFRREKDVLEMTTQKRQDLEEIAARHAKYPPTSIGNFFRQLWAASHFHFPENPVRAPVLFLAGGQDQLVHYVCTQRLAHAWQSECHIHPTAGHDLPLDAPDWIIERLLSWRETLV